MLYLCQKYGYHQRRENISELEVDLQLIWNDLPRLLDRSTPSFTQQLKGYIKASG